MKSANNQVASYVSLWIVAVVVIWIVAVTVVYDRCALEIDALNARIRVVLMTGENSLRHFDKSGLPLSYSARSRKEFLSPFYVVHYGLMYSEMLPNREQYDGPAWRHDGSIRFWDVPPTKYGPAFFKNCADWVVHHVSQVNGQAHLIYNFNWPYRNYPNGGLKAPWWSGLTDGYAIILMLRANDIYHDPRYMAVASELYKSVLTPISRGGSLNVLRGRPWIEEYVDPRANTAKLPFVLNGMIYATYGVDAYERYMKVKNPVAKSLYQSISYNIPLYDLGRWSSYDDMGNVANIKYHGIDTALLKSIEEKTGDKDIGKIRARWIIGRDNAGYYWLINGQMGVAKAQFIIEFLLSLLCVPGALFLIYIKRLKNKKRRLKTSMERVGL